MGDVIDARELWERSTINGAEYKEPDLPQPTKRAWSNDTWFRRRLAKVRRDQEWGLR